ncbi:hypothetical protein ABKV19_027605, partial [Rosa sericea]
NVKVNVDDYEIVPPPTDMGGTCELAVNTISNIVSFGTVFDDEDMTKTIHGVPLKEGCLRVSVDGEIQGDTPLLFPILNEMELVRKAIGSHVAWPEELVIRKHPSKILTYSLVHNVGFVSYYHCRIKYYSLKS